MRALQSFHTERPDTFGRWFEARIRDSQGLPWSWDEEDAEILLTWYRRYGWKRHFTDRAPETSSAAAALGVALAQTYNHFFAKGADTAVWRPLAELLDLPEGPFGENVSRLLRCLDLYRDCSGESELVNLIPFLNLVGCPQQALPALGHYLKERQQLPKRFRALVGSQWPAGFEQKLRQWVRQGGRLPDGLHPEQAALLQQGAERKNKQSSEAQAPGWRCFLDLRGSYQLSLLPTRTSPTELWHGPDGRSYQGRDAQVYGVLQSLGQDGWMRGSEGLQEAPWPDTPILWSELPEAPMGMAKAYRIAKGRSANLVCLPPGWSVDGEGESAWRWEPIDAGTSFVDPEGNIWQPRDEEIAWEVLDSITLADHPDVKVIHRLPKSLPAMTVSSGELGSTLGPTGSWKPECEDIPPLGHLRLTWVTGKGRQREKEVLCLPTLQFTRSHGEPMRLWIRGMKGLLGFEKESETYDLPVEAHRSHWEAHIALEGWGKKPLELLLKGPLMRWGGHLVGNPQAYAEARLGPWSEGPSFQDEANCQHLRIGLDLPEGIEASVWLEEGGNLLPRRTFLNGKFISPLEFRDALQPLWPILDTYSRPVRVSLAWPDPARPDYTASAPLFRFFPRDAQVGVRSIGGGVIHVRPKYASTTLEPEAWRLILESTIAPEDSKHCAVSELQPERAGNGFTLKLPRLGRARAPYYVGLRHPEHDILFGIHLTHDASPIAGIALAHRRALQQHQTHAPEIRLDLPDQRDQALSLIYDLAESTPLLKMLDEPEISHWLGFLDDDFLFSQPWTLALALRHPRYVLEHVVRSGHSGDELARILGNLGQSGWNWWLLPPLEWADMDTAPRSLITVAVQTLAYRRIEALDRITNEAVRTLAVTRLCEEGLFRMLPSGQDQRYFLNRIGIPLEWLSRSWRPDEMAQAILNPTHEFITRHRAALLENNPAPPPPLPHPGRAGLPGLPLALERLSHLAGWGRAYQAWARSSTNSLILENAWPDATPEIFRHYGPLMTLFTSLDWKE